MDIPAITSATATATSTATAVSQPTATLASNAADKAAESTSVAKPARERRVETDDTKLDAPERDSRSLQYLVQGNRVITTIVDDQSKKVVVQIPDAELIRIAKSIDRMQGFFIEENA